MALAIDWQARVDLELEAMKKELLKKADRQVAEQISRQQDENINKYRSIAQEPADLTIQQKTEDGPERVCYECVEAGDLNTAFSTILRYIDSTAQTKAERKDVTGKATNSYAKSLFDKLSVITHQQINEMTDGLQKALESRIDNLMNQFTFIQSDINKRIDRTELNIYQLSESVHEYSILNKKRQPKHRATNFQQRKIDLERNTSYQFSNNTKLTPRRQALKKSFDMSKKQIISHFKATPPEPNKVHLSITKMKKQK
ncbi:hypothetical protein TRFO_18597 [Tritrichomonas foetus]|uniref:Uncharacterized protein n=1 Tax=Tritrichomonas foetus TaxID=1144522 RepID=A0A1J4KPU6_9EUKA|nr:hypothetical protein TRFO_18597 [Tritrichomonas foetus]|eukprot:OHT11812.1 hypothetical protein TRFO_18597 [Tritrichomonas foetus]